MSSITAVLLLLLCCVVSCDFIRIGNTAIFNRNYIVAAHYTVNQIHVLLHNRTTPLTLEFYYYANAQQIFDSFASELATKECG